MAKKSKKRKTGCMDQRPCMPNCVNTPKARTPVAKISKLMKRTVGALRQQALKLGIGLGHQR